LQIKRHCRMNCRAFATPKHCARGPLPLLRPRRRVKPGNDAICGIGKGSSVITIWGRNTSANVQKVMWAVAEIGLPHERVDIGGPFGRNREAAYLAKNPNGLVPTLEEEDGFLLWESNSIVRYLAAKHPAALLEPADLRARARAGAWMDWQLSVLGPAIFDCFWGLVRTPPEKRNYAAIEESKKKTTAAIAILDGELAHRAYVASEAFSYGDIPPAVMANRYRALVPERPAFPHFERWFAAIAARPAFKNQVAAVPLA
jgi:glutathione S-transferase